MAVVYNKSGPGVVQSELLLLDPRAETPAAQECKRDVSRDGVYRLKVDGLKLRGASVLLLILILMEAPVPKPRARYLLGPGFRSLSTESDVTEPPVSSSRTTESENAAGNNNTSAAPPPSCPLTPIDGTSDSSADESQQSDRTSEPESAKQCHNYTDPTPLQVSDKALEQNLIQTHPVITNKPRHQVLWVTFDGQLISLWKKRSDKFPVLVFHVSSITNIHQHDQGLFTLFFHKKHLEFMAHSEAVQTGWVTSLLASRGREPPPAPAHHGPLLTREPRSKVYAAICGHTLWIYKNREDFNLGLGRNLLSMNIVTVKLSGRHNFSLVTPYKTFSFSADSSRELQSWLDHLNQVIRNALSCSEVALRFWSSPWNKVCADCGSPNPEWASINLLMVVCEACAGVHRSLGSSRSKVRGLKLDSKVWTEPLIELFVNYGNKAANNVWAHNVPAEHQIFPDAPQDQRAAFINNKYCRGLYCKVHPLSTSQALLNERLCAVVCGADVEETLSLLCSGAKVSGGEGPSLITLAENAGQLLQAELLRHNESVDVPDFRQVRQKEEETGLEELHGRLDEERFLFSRENESAACDVLDLREVIAVFDRSAGETHEFEILTLSNTLICNTDTQQSLQTHLLHVIKVLVPGQPDERDLEGAMAISQVYLREGRGLQHAEVWALIRPGEVFIFPSQPNSPRSTVTLNQQTQYNLRETEKTIDVTAAGKTVHLQFQHEQNCSRFYSMLSTAASTERKWNHQSMYKLPVGISGSVSPQLERCISHITLYGLKVEGLYRCCGMVTKISKLVEKLQASPAETVLETDEDSILNVAGALKHFLRQEPELIRPSERRGWVEASVQEDLSLRLQEYQRLVKLLPPDNRATLSALLNHLYIVQLHSQVNRMTAHNLALVFVPTLFQELAMNPTVVQLTEELIVHHALIFLSSEEAALQKEMITVF
ncbi:arf-GAP with Rho-GAP domain, ANK repeat and PH domain-containing protein 1 [Trichomycterus rosablanca]|uniref:arf-GAP with Rho-GAP domain, ANK repeat and PH domain-containing protein 1 n=1 Tax=Trichomycterus rosablanca TaxID=2290929 RepID=UPI002F35DF51